MGWITIAGRKDESLEKRVKDQVSQKIAEGKFKQADVDYIARIDRRPVSGDYSVSEERLERIRRLCQLWELDFQVGEITSHRPLIGKFIVAFKKLLFPLLRVLLKDTLRKQRDFNAQVITILADLSRDTSRKN